MVEVVEYAVLFHQPGDEIERRFTILHTILKCGIRAGQALPELRETEKAEYLADDIRRGHVLEDSAIGLAGEEPEPGHHLGMVASKVAFIRAALRKTAYVTVNVARSAVGKLNRDRDILADNISE